MFGCNRVTQRGFAACTCSIREANSEIEVVYVRKLHVNQRTYNNSFGTSDSGSEANVMAVRGNEADLLAGPVESSLVALRSGVDTGGGFSFVGVDFGVKLATA